VLLADLLDPDDEQVAATVAVIAAADADILVLQDIDYDAGGAALSALRDRLAEAGAVYPYFLSLRPNTGWPTGIDLDGDGRAHGPRDAHGYGRFNGEGGMAILSRFPIGPVRDHSRYLWRELPGSHAPRVVPEAALPILRLATVAAWDVALDLPGGAFHVLTLHATPPVFDGPEDRNGWRNADELRFWHLYLDGWSPDDVPFAAQDFALVGTFNVDPDRGEGRRGALNMLLDHPRLQDPVPTGAGGTATADWDDPVPGDLRVDYILPSAGATVRDSGVVWGDVDGPEAAASDHRLIWVDLAF
jgi:endonuclease/exonuclease/phosphatase family metal-dependent hydrolase